jgi:hypothetical protein
MLPETIAAAWNSALGEPQPAEVSLDPELNVEFPRQQRRLDRDGEAANRIAGRGGMRPQLGGKRCHRPPL